MNVEKHKYQTKFIPHSSITAHNSEGKKHIALIAGGMSAEREVSIISSEGTLKTLLDLGYRVTSIDMGADIASVLADIKPDIVFNCLHGTYGEDGCLPGLLNIMRIPYTHSGVLSSALAFNKIKSKQFFVANDITTARSVIVSKKDGLKTDPMPRPYVIKPVTQGSSIGIEVIFTEDNFDFANYSFPYGEQIIVEEYIRGREMQVAVLNGKALGILEIELLKNRFYDYETKYTEGFANHILPAKLPEQIYQDILLQAEKAYKLMDCNGMVRVEFIYNEELNKNYILELNTHPGMTPLSICPEIAAFVGINFPAFIEELLNSARFES